MTAASNSEAMKRAAGIAASNPTAPEPTGTLEGAPGADSEALVAVIEVIACAIRDEWDPSDRTEWAEQHAKSALNAVLASSWLADHDRQIAAAAWFAGYDKGNLDGHFGTSDERTKSPYSDLDPYSEEARRG